MSCAANSSCSRSRIQLFRAKTSTPEVSRSRRWTWWTRGFSILEVTLESGRRNQIRVHLAEAGHPVVGDTMYGRGYDESLGRLGLHAKHLGFVHPRTGSKVTLTSEVPKSFYEILR